ncbi:MAG: 3-hydroxyacyl-CoA dehydrogenase family protein [Bacteroidia bacterium]|nr:3-hydroxyacyl-CoA dehydrogenase family protein [Bacteroidia bacterium]MDW8088174.1 3-hydroxyacyl-CoA dehydrogenase family protein [Bacteroidia bacterium]
MPTLVIGSAERLAALMAGVGRRWQPDLWEWPSRTAPNWSFYEVIVDLEADERPSPAFQLLPGQALWVFQSVRKPLAAILPDQRWWPRAVGVNLLPGFCEREVVEATALTTAAWERFKAWEPHSLRVPDQVGLVSARLLCLILNEALWLAAEGGVSLETLDTAVQLGLNYPYTISQWGQRIGWSHVRAIVEALQAEYGAGVYAVAPFLRAK